MIETSYANDVFLRETELIFLSRMLEIYNSSSPFFKTFLKFLLLLLQFHPEQLFWNAYFHANWPSQFKAGMRVPIRSMLWSVVIPYTMAGIIHCLNSIFALLQLRIVSLRSQMIREDDALLRIYNEPSDFPITTLFHVMVYFRQNLLC